MRCWIIACLMFLGAELWSSEQHFTIRSVMQEAPRFMGAGGGVVLFISSLVCFSWDWRLACWGLLVSILAMCLALIPAVAYN
jgi:hypothetical protein